MTLGPVLALVLAAFQPPPAPNQRAGPYIDIVRRYAAGQHAEAVAAVQDVDPGIVLRYGIPHLGHEPPLMARAAVMLHTDRRFRDREDLPGSEEERCASAHADLASHAAELLMRDPAGTAFVRRFYLATVLKDQWDGCFDEARQWIDKALRLFPDDADLLLASGTLHESVGALTPRQAARLPPAGSRARRAHMAGVSDRVHSLAQARLAFEKALAVDAQRHEARVRLGRVAWRQRRPAEAVTAFETVLASGAAPPLKHLAHLFLGRVHEDAGRHEQAARAYRSALDLQRTSQGAALGLAHVLRQAGDTGTARDLVDSTLAVAGQRQFPQSIWEYPFGRARTSSDLLDALRGDVR